MGNFRLLTVRYKGMFNTAICRADFVCLMKEKTPLQTTDFLHDSTSVPGSLVQKRVSLIQGHFKSNFSTACSWTLTYT